MAAPSTRPGGVPLNRDTLIGIVGAVLLVTAMVGVFQYERAQASGVLAPQGQLSNATAAGPSLDGTVAVGQTESALANVTAQNVTRVTFTLTWTPGGQGTDTLQLTVAPPTGAGVAEGAQSEPESDGEITVTVDVPNDPANGTGTAGVGAWKVEVAFVSAAGPGGLPVGADQTVAWTVATELQTYARA